VAEETPEGLVKIIALKNGRILGASIVGPNAGEQIALWSLAVSRKLKMSAIASLVLPYPTLGEAGKRAAISYFAELPGKPWLRKLIGILKLFG
jgi:pyruvate/2-oxoglutarate dehydrogenase complex dihydrolipoamide dehydrogenase (E3) component